MSAYNFVHSGPNFTKFLLFNAQKFAIVNAVYILRSNSKILVIRANFCTFFALPNFKGGGAPKSCTCVNTPLRAASGAKFSSGYNS